MLRVLNGDLIIKLAIVFSFFAGYSWVYQTMVKDEKVFERRYAQRFEQMEKLSQAEAPSN